MSDAATSDRRRPPRKDTARNRLALIAAAREAFAQQGFHTPLEPIASAAGLGNATLYRHFPTRAALWEAVALDPMREVLAIVSEALDDRDAWDGLVHYLVATSAMEARQGGFTALMTTHFAGAPTLIELRAQVQNGIDALVRRAHAAGAIRSDVVETDFAMIAVGMTAVVQATRDAAPDGWRRHLGILLDGLRTPSPQPLGAEPVGRGQIWRALMRSPSTTERGKPRD